MQEGICQSQVGLPITPNTPGAKLEIRTVILCRLQRISREITEFRNLEGTKLFSVR